MIQFSLIFASILGGLAVIFGAFGAHLLKRILNEEQLKSFETGVKYQMYHAIVLLLIGNRCCYPIMLKSTFHF